MISTTTLEAIERFKQTIGPYLLEIEGCGRSFRASLHWMTSSSGCVPVPCMR